MSQSESSRATERKVCSQCRLAKTRDEFSPSSTKPGGLHCYCKPCSAEQQRRRNEQKTPAIKRSDARARFARKMRARFGISIEEYDEIVSNPCALCGSAKYIVLDHCHDSGAIRGPLCRPCISALGIFGDDPDRLRAAADYIESHRT